MTIAIMASGSLLLLAILTTPVAVEIGEWMADIAVGRVNRNLKPPPPNHSNKPPDRS